MALGAWSLEMIFFAKAGPPGGHDNVESPRGQRRIAHTLMADQRFGVVIIGAGIIGTSIAYHLARRGRTDVAVLEKEPASGLGSTAKAAGGIRVQFSSRINVELSRLSIDRFENF